MLCQNCGKNNANVKYTQIINGKKKEMVLCEKCAEKMGINNFEINMPIHFSNFLDDFFDEEELLPSFMKETSNECKICGELYDDFINSGLLGCPECYDEFEDKLDNVLKNIQGHTKHVGREPLNISKKMKNIGENKAEKVNLNNEKMDNNKENKLEKLQQELNIAIKEERYEDAAVIRDEIKKINNEK